jgi:hypothetical protein
MTRWFASRDRLLCLLADGKPRCTREVREELRLTKKAAESVCRTYWKTGLLLRSEKPLLERNGSFAGRAGTSYNTRHYHLYLLDKRHDETAIDDIRFLSFARTPKIRRENKSQLIMQFLRDNPDRAFYTSQIVERIKDKGVRISDIACNLRRYEKKGLVYFRGYRSAEHETPFEAGYIVTYIDPNKDRSIAVSEATQRTQLLIEGGSHSNPLADRIRMIRDELLKARELKEIVSPNFLQQRLHCSEDQLRFTLDRAKQLFKDEIREVKIFNFPYYYHAALNEDDLKIAIAAKQNYIRKVKGKHNRIGHNWEACVEFFVDKLTKGAEFWEQTHRSRMDRRRITLKLVRPTGERKLFAEVDRVWTIQPSPISQPVTYVLECKWGLVRKESLEDFLNVLKWSMDFGFDSQQGRMIKQGVIGIFAGTAFNPKDKVKVGSEVLSVAQYAARMSIQLLKASDLNEILHKREVHKSVTVQKTYTRARNEGEVREILGMIWNQPKDAQELIGQLVSRNANVFEFERELETPSNQESNSREECIAVRTA